MTHDATVEQIGGHFTGLHPKQRSALANLVLAVLMARLLTLSEMGRETAIVTGKQPRQIIKQLSRTLSNPNLNVNALWRLWIVWVLATAKEVVIAVDWTSLRKDERRVLYAALCTTDGRTIPLLALTVVARKLKSRQGPMERRLLDLLREFIPADVRVLITADRGFDGAPFRARCALHHFHFLIRVRSNLIVHHKGRKCKVVDLCPKKRGGGVRSFENLELTWEHHKVARLVTAFDIKAQEPLAVVTDLTDLAAERIVALYGLRFQIEEMFRDLKNARLGMGLEHLDVGNRGNDDRMALMLLVVSIGYTLIRRTGQLARAAGLARQFSTRGGNGGTRHSTFSLGKFHVRATPRRLAEALTSVDSLGFAAVA